MLSFYGNNSAWNVDKSGDHLTDCDTGRLLADELLRHPAPEIVLPHVVRAMVAAGPDEFGAIEIAFLTAVVEGTT